MQTGLIALKYAGFGKILMSWDLKEMRCSTEVIGTLVFVF